MDVHGGEPRDRQEIRLEDLRRRHRHEQIRREPAQLGDVLGRVDVLDDPAGDPVAGREPIDGAAPPATRGEQVERLRSRVAAEQADEVEPAVEAVELPRQRAARRLIQGGRDVDAQELEPVRRELGEELPEEDREVERILLGDDVQAERSRAHVRSIPTRRHVTDVRPR